MEREDRTEQDEGEQGGAQYDNPNQEVVRGSGPGEEGEGGQAGETQPAADEGESLDGLTKDELLDVADERGVEVDEKATKADIRARLEGRG